MNARRIPGTNTGNFNELTGRLTDRDFEIIHTLAKRKIMTAGMLEAVFFSSAHSAAARLLTLHEMGILARWRSPSSRAYRYVLDWRGQCVQAMRTDEKPPTKQAGTYKAQQMFMSTQRAHTEAVNAFFCRLHRGARNRPDVRVAKWDEPRYFPFGPRPDGSATLEWNDGNELHFMLEHDRGTETLQRLADKVESYKHDARDSSGKQVLLIEVISQGRLTNLIPAATAHWVDTRQYSWPTKLTVAVSAATAAERSFISADGFPDPFDDRRWHVLGYDETYCLNELPHVADEIASRSRIL
ncbi:replication-relaxation family protein [Glycomyces sp. NRRL B-16210]|uniref:replication-relaxation family protein n=1 Tax=Glycomyces sp. NRRL B-16210 TaxID=1463821 RepID=UPI001061562B|nr:replication-relaxation family protein [Glycomyces sp. NRRL B-16210]